MARSMWSGVIQFGLVSVPVKSYKAVDELDVKFNQYVKINGEYHEVGRKNIDKATNADVAYADIIKCYRRADGSLVEFSADDAKAFAAEASRVIEVDHFVDVQDVDPIYFGRSEYLAPDKFGEKNYAIFSEALVRSGKVGIARTVRGTKEHTVILRATDGAVVMTYMNYADEIRPVDDLNIPAVDADEAMVDMAGVLIDTLTKDFDGTSYRDGHREKVLAHLESANPAEGTAATPVAPAAPANDLMASLRASVDAAKAARKPAAKRPARKAPAKRASRSKVSA